MPLGPAHPAAVLPIQRTGLPLSALVVGSVSPDAPVYLPLGWLGVEYATTHSASGVLVATAIGVAMLAVWYFVLRDAVVDLVPWLRDRSPAHVRPAGRTWLLAVPALAIGAATHVLWDSATHDWGFIVEASELLREDLGPAPVYRLLQHLSTIVGSAVVVAYGVHRLRLRPVVARPAAVPRSALWLVPVPVAALVAGIGWRDVDAAVEAALLSAVVVALAWRSLRREPGPSAVPG